MNSNNLSGLGNLHNSVLNQTPDRYISISIEEQRLQLIDHKQIVFDVIIATATNGAGEQFGSECTPRGWHKIRAKIGEHCAENTVFTARRPTGEIYTDSLQQAHPNRDWILTRIMWLSGLEPGYNRLGQQDTMRRYIYIHGCPDNNPMGIPSSHGCIKMRNSDVIALFDQVEVGIPVFISETSDRILKASN
ncbi:MAG: L,D-transpeptidase [Gammaproteobacteria bacterium]|nr:L,D-transpeptidase [Gammaproteobacteria bacterium]